MEFIKKTKDFEFSYKHRNFLQKVLIKVNFKFNN